MVHLTVQSTKERSIRQERIDQTVMLPLRKAAPELQDVGMLVAEKGGKNEDFRYYFYE